MKLTQPSSDTPCHLQADADGSGSITLEEFAEFFCSIRKHLSCTEAEAKELMRKKPFERNAEDIVRLRNYLATSQPFFQRFTREILEEVGGVLRCLLEEASLGPS